MASYFRTLTKGMGYDQIRDVAPPARKKYCRIAYAAQRVMNLSWRSQLLRGGTAVERQIDEKCHKLASVQYTEAHKKLIYRGNT
jgi:hypothetical protein